MRKALAAIVGTAALIAVTAIVATHRVNSRHAAELAEQQAAWQAERAALEEALEQANARARDFAAKIIPAPAAPTAPAKITAAEMIAQLAALKSAPNNPRTMRKAVYWLEELIAAGPAALPAIREFLGRNEEIDFAPANIGRSGRTSPDTP